MLPNTRSPRMEICSRGSRNNRDISFSQENAMTRLFKSLFIATVICSVAISPAWADPPRGYQGGGHGGYRGGGHGDGWWGALGLALFGTAVFLAATAPPPPSHPAPVYFQQPTVITQAAPQPALVSEQNWWYYCSQPAGYYPYVKACPTGWTRVSPIPPDR